ncbi:S1C family serine protease [Fusibacter tunisiensis]|uniref:Serine protease Do n=1 Tax=Fusibacter tunisiensis TaxID=1008308 RepID=A0ABS2MSJ8_9FIRM|nr:trypsin-like peptidase domain-containing protein [Fusibacter tunisiensis]MBM7562406.1 serine protease Do [Fusibacter tunisiensis]
MDFEKYDRTEEDIFYGTPRTVENTPSGGPKKGRGKQFFVFLLILALISGTTYTIGYYYGQINLNTSKIETQVQTLLKDNYEAEIYTAVADYLDENGTDVQRIDTDYSQIYDNISGSIVGITSKKTYYDWFNIQRQTGGSGSGVVVGETPDAFYIVTNFHVIDGATEVVVDITEGEVAEAKLVGHDSDTDLAVVSIQKSDISELIVNTMKPIQIGDSNMLKVGEPAIAIGNPLGYNRTLTAGFVSALDRDVQDDAGVKYIQIDAAINPGNSGGALVNRKGELVGINTAKIVDTQVEGIGFAIPSNTMKPIVDEIIENGYVSRPYIGIGGVEIGEDDSELYEIPMGVMIRYIYEGSPAEKAGLKESDLIIGVDSVKVFTMDDLTGYISDLKPGDTIDLKIIRNGDEKMTVEIVLGNRGQN